MATSVKLSGSAEKRTYKLKVNEHKPLLFMYFITHLAVVEEKVSKKMDKRSSYNL